MKKIMQSIFSIKNKNNHKILCLFGLKISFKNNNFQIEYLMSKINDLLQQNRRLLYESKIRQQKMFSVYNLHQQVFPQFKNKYWGKNIAIVGCGPTLNYYEPINAIFIALNRALDYDKIKFDYNFWVDGCHDTRDYLKLFTDYKCTKFYGQHVNFFPYYGENGNGNIPEYDAIRDNAYRFYSNAFDEEVFPDISTCPIFDLGTVAHCAIQFALWTHPKRIYIIGCDCNNNGYFNNKKQPKWDLLEKAINGYKILKHFRDVYYPDIEIISVNPVGLKGLFKDVYTQSYIDAHPKLKNENVEIINEEGLCKNL